jgi:hypothetical protein
MYAKIVNNQVSTYPYSLSELRKENPNVSFPQDALSREDVASLYGIVEIQSTEKPSASGYKPVEGDLVNEDGVWKQSWSLVVKDKSQVSPDEVTNTEMPVRDGYLYESEGIEWDGSKWIQSWSEVELTALDIDVVQKRIMAYGSVAEQIEHIVENGLDSWIAKVDEIKAKYPK